MIKTFIVQKFFVENKIYSKTPPQSLTNKLFSYVLLVHKKIV